MKEAQEKDVPGNQRKLDKRLATSNIEKYRKLGEERRKVLEIC